jgi:tetratricopeptide (TPR) repeat protein
MGYDAFISYSHVADGRLAPALQGALHRFAKPWWKLRAVNVFRDETSLAAAHDLTQSIRDALQEARYFILLASPASAGSAWVEREVRFWLEHKSVAHVLIVLTEGHIAWGSAGDFDWSRTTALAPALAGVFKAEPLWVDLSFARSSEQLSTHDPRFQQAVARLAARLHGKSLDVIAGEEVRQYRRTRRIARAAVSSIAALALVAVMAAWFAYRGQRRAEVNLEQALNGVDGLAKLVAKDMQDDAAGIAVTLRLKMLNQAGSILANLDAGGEGDAIAPIRAATLAEFAAAYGTLGKYDEANVRVSEAIRLLTQRTRGTPSDLHAAAELARAHKTFGELLYAEGKAPQRAVEEFERAAAAFSALSKATPAHPDADDWRLSAYRSLIIAGDVYVSLASGMEPRASSACADPKTCFAKARDLFQRALGNLQTEPDEAADAADGFRWRNAALAGRQRLARIAEAGGDLLGARAVYSTIANDYAKMSAALPQQMRWKENQIGMYWSIGRVDALLCDRQAARQSYGEALALARELHRIEPARADWHRHLARSLIFAARAALAAGDVKQARSLYAENRAENAILARAQPDDSEIKSETVESATQLASAETIQVPACVGPVR